jgi:magnesium transporter
MASPAPVPLATATQDYIHPQRLLNSNFELMPPARLCPGFHLLLQSYFNIPDQVLFDNDYGKIRLSLAKIVGDKSMAISETKKPEATPGVGKESQQPNIQTISWGDLTWVNIEHPTRLEMAYLAQNYSFNQLDLDDCLSRRQRPKLDVYQNYLFFIFHFSVYSRETRVSTHGQVSTFIGGKYLITVHNGELRPLVNLFHDCQASEEAREQNFSHGSGYLLYRILDRMVDAYFPILDKILSLLEGVEDSVFDEKVEAAQEVAILRRDIITQRRIIFPTRTAIAELEGKLKPYTSIDLSAHWGDLMDHMNKACETLDECKEVIEVFKDADFVLSTEYINRIVRVLTILATVMLPFMVVSSLYGMNVHLPGGLTNGNFLSFLLLLLAMALLAGGMLYFFHRKHWI